MAKAQIKLNQQQLSQLESILKLGVGVISQIAEFLESMTGDLPLKFRDLSRLIVGHIGLSKSDADTLVQQSLAMNGLMRKTKMDAGDVVSAVNEFVSENSSWDEVDKAAWLAIAGQFEKIIVSKPVRAVSSAILLSYDYANLLNRAKILTDIRPIFSQDASAIDAAVVSFTLRIKFDSADEEREFSIAMDQDDVLQMKNECDRALAKAKVALDAVKTKMNVPGMITGED